VADAQIGLGPGGAEELDLGLRLRHRTALEQSPRAGQGGLGLPARGAMGRIDPGRAGPQRRLVQGEAGPGGGAPDHRAEPTVAERQGLEPALGGAATGEGGSGGPWTCLSSGAGDGRATSPLAPSSATSSPREEVEAFLRDIL